MEKYNKQELLSVSNKVISAYQEIISNKTIPDNIKKIMEDNVSFISELIKTSIFIDKEPLEIRTDFYELFNNVISENITSISLIEIND